MESPPRSKKLSWTPMPPMPSVSSHSRVTARSRSVRGATCGVVSRGRDASPAVPGGGRLLRLGRLRRGTGARGVDPVPLPFEA
ncbi:hypothetical protein STENM223S_10753 [Streptomyces tendae]